MTMTGPADAGRVADHRDHGGLRVVAEDDSIDLDAAERAVRDLLVALGRDPDSEHLAGTARRVAHTYAELLNPEPFDLATFPNDEAYDELVLVRDISFTSLCQHHLLPFHGVAHVGYLPAERILGLSKLARIVKLFAADFQTKSVSPCRWPVGSTSICDRRVLAWSSKPTTNACPYVVCGPKAHAPSPRQFVACLAMTPVLATSSSLSPARVGK